MQRIEADLLIPGRGEPVRGGVVVLDGTRIAFAGPRDHAPTSGANDAVRVAVVMPGLWDCHGHFMGLRTANLEELLTNPTALAAARATKDAETALQAGFTSVREVGGLGVFLARAIAEGLVRGPSIYGAGSVLSQTGGHGDVHRMPLPTVVDYGLAGGALHLCDGVPDCLKAVRLQLRRGARLIKVCASGGVLSELDDPVHQQFSDDELRAIVEEAGRAERAVAAHCHGKPGIMAALRAGCRTIEHGTYLDDEAAAAMRAAGAILVPTRFIIERILMGKDRVPPYAFAKLEALADRHREAMHIARENGVTVALGTDIATSGPGTLAPWGANGVELRHLVDAGFTALQAIEAGTATGPLTLGPQAPQSGVLAEGYDADVIALDASPLEDIAVLGDAAFVTHVWKAGALVKGELTPRRAAPEPSRSSAPVAPSSPARVHPTRS
jgi:imidazolonepropionase-like amidohydrolase